MDLSEISDNQNRHPWELSRTRCILRVLRDIGIKGNILDIGCGDSYFDKRLAEKFLDVEVYGVDIFLEKEMHEGRVHAVNSLERLPIDKFDYILMMDVIEHIEDGVAYLANILKYLKEGGKVIITVPAFMALYSLHDRELQHYRRYSHQSLGRVIKESGLIELKWSYFYFSLIIGRLLTMNRTKNLGNWNYSETDFKTKLITCILNLDFDVLTFLSKLGFHLPGLSLLSIASVKPSSWEPYGCTLGGAHR